jgi:hypothetical protein
LIPRGKGPDAEAHRARVMALRQGLAVALRHRSPRLVRAMAKVTANQGLKGVVAAQTWEPPAARGAVSKGVH